MSVFLGPPATADDDQTVSRYEQLKDAAAGGGIVGGTLLLDSTPRTFDNIFSDADNDLPVSLKVLSTGDDDFNRSLCFVVPDINNKTVNEVEAAASNIITDTAETISTDLDGGDEEGGDVVHCTKIVLASDIIVLNASALVASNNILWMKLKMVEICER
jgi:hypothetical protein